MGGLVNCPHCSTRVLPMAGRTCPACGRDVDSRPDPGPGPEERVAAAAYGFAAEQVRRGAAPSAVAKGLAGWGLDPAKAAAVVRDLEWAKADAVLEAGRRNMLYGALWCTGGIAATALSYLMASGFGGRYVAATGAILFGGFRFVRGLVQSAVA